MKYLQAITQHFDEKEVIHSADPEQESVRAIEELNHNECTGTDAGANNSSHQFWRRLDLLLETMT
tara:strand:- start:1106 stop:1300 length:195 start_codon:yes stop_codon:yes gene_type:complete